MKRYVVIGMCKELAFQLYGALDSDRSSNKDTKWEYVNDKGQLVIGLTFKFEKVETIYGDPKGGAKDPVGCAP